MIQWHERTFELRPLEPLTQCYRYNGGNWIPDDGEYDLAFLGFDSSGFPVCVYLDIDGDKNIQWHWTKNGISGNHVAEHPNGSCWHYMLFPGKTDFDDGFDTFYNHPNNLAHDSASSVHSELLKNGCLNGRGPDFYIGDDYIKAGLLRDANTKEVIKFPKIFKCMDCGDHDWFAEENPDLPESKLYLRRIELKKFIIARDKGTKYIGKIRKEIKELEKELSSINK